MNDIAGDIRMKKCGKQMERWIDSMAIDERLVQDGKAALLGCINDTCMMQGARHKK